MAKTVGGGVEIAMVVGGGVGAVTAVGEGMGASEGEPMLRHGCQSIK